ncbi:hypothetical protein QQF64_031586 [Cirrhinus molitorella]|uniref:Uncharacterized protein n=1 Tax=Cirrhinus molitorella TaxID=172907 RepID=A0ABR3MXD7_9TELE
MQWWESVEARETSCHTSLVFENESEKADSLHSGFPDATLKTKEPRRQKKTHCDKEDHRAPEEVEAEEASESTCSCWGAPVPAGSLQGRPETTGSQWRGKLKIPDYLRQLEPAGSPQGAPVPAGSLQGPPKTTGSQWRGKLMIPDYLKQHVLKAASELGVPVPARSPQVAPVPKVSPQETPMTQDLLQQKPQASSVHGAPMPYKTPERQRLKIPEPLSKELLQLSARASAEKGVPVSN